MTEAVLVKLKHLLAVEQCKMTTLIEQNEIEPSSASHIAGDMIQAAADVV
jgi:hypothetical protein